MDIASKLRRAFDDILDAGVILMMLACLPIVFVEECSAFLARKARGRRRL